MATNSGVSPTQRAYALSVGTAATGGVYRNNRSPTSSDVNFTIGQIWLNTSAITLFILVSFTSSAGVVTANWEPILSSLETVSDTAGTLVHPSSSGNIQFKSSDASVSIISDPADHYLDFQVLGAGLNWILQADDITAAASTGYFSNKGSLLTITLPASSTIGDTFEVVNYDGNGFKIAQLASQSIQLGTLVTQTGTGGYLESESIGDWIELVAISDTQWQANIKQGNVTVIT